MNEGSLKPLNKKAQVTSLEFLEGILKTLAKLVYEQGTEDDIILWAAAIEALKDIKKEDRLSYESKEAPHQYYLHEDVPIPSGSPYLHAKEPLLVERMDVNMRGNRDVGLGMV